MNLVKTAWIFDVDGVITNKLTQRANPKIVKIISSLIIAGDPVAFITGRSISWLKKELINDLEKHLGDLISLSNVYAVAEFGGVHLEYDYGKEKIKIEKTLLPPRVFRKEVENIIDDFSDVMWIEEKQTITTVTAKIGYPTEKFREKQKILIGRLKGLLEKYNLSKNYKVQADPFATNVRNKKLNKSSSVTEVLRWLEQKNIKINKFYIFGDALSDTEMAVELYRMKKEFIFIYVGYKEDLDGEKFPFDINYTMRKFDEGTLEYLERKLG